MITSVTYSNSEARLTLFGVPDKPGAAARIFTALTGANVVVDMISQNEPASAKGLAELSFTVPRAELSVAEAALAPLTGDSFARLKSLAEMGKVSIVGAGFRSHPEVYAKVFGVLAQEGVNIDMISTSPIKISCMIASDEVLRVAHLLHSTFGLVGEGTLEEEDPFHARKAL